MTVEFIDLQPQQIITSGYEFLHDTAGLELYYTLCREGKPLPAVPVMHRELAFTLSPELQERAATFMQQHPDATYFLLDGSHRTTAACLCHHQCRAMVIADDACIAETKTMGKLAGRDVFRLENENTIQDVVRSLIQDFREHPVFQTAQEKTEKLIAAGKIPAHMATQYRKSCSPRSTAARTD